MSSYGLPLVLTNADDGPGFPLPVKGTDHARVERVGRSEPPKCFEYPGDTARASRGSPDEIVVTHKSGKMDRTGEAGNMAAMEGMQEVEEAEEVEEDAAGYLPRRDALETQDSKAAHRDVPVHPIASMQQAFAESLVEVTAVALPQKPRLRSGDAKSRREQLLDQDRSEGAPGALWRFRPGQQCHELRKLMSQVSFGVYLLLNSLANSNSQVVSILQGHIDEIDEFLEMTMEDIDLATNDLTERIDYLKLPMDNMAVFKTMLEDRNFRLQIVEGNAKIEHILSRTTTALVQSDQDISEGLRSTRQFIAYLASQETGPWRVERPDVIDIFDAMRGNTEGWLNAFSGLQSKINSLNALIVRLDNMVALIERTAGKVSRKTRFSTQPLTGPEQAESAAWMGQGVPRSNSSVESLTPPASPPPAAAISRSPPRLSLRFSRMPEERPSGPTYFDLPLRTSLLLPGDIASDLLNVPPITPHRGVEPVSAGKEADAASDFDVDDGININIDSVTKRDAAGGEDSGCGARRLPGPTPRKSISSWGRQQAISALFRPDSPTAGGALYMLQPRTYTPVPPAPLPSPRIREDCADEDTQEHNKNKNNNSNYNYNYNDNDDDDDDDDGGGGGGGSPPPAPSLPPPPPPIPEMSQSRRVLPSDGHADPVFALGCEPDESGSTASTARGVPKLVRISSSGSKVDSPRGAAMLPLQGQGSDSSPIGPKDAIQEAAQPKRTSLRQRISLKTNPPESIHVPPPNAVELHRPVFTSPRTYQAYQTFVAPDSAYGSDIDRTAVNSMATDRAAAGASGAADFSPPVFPGLIPSPHSDQQYFRPVQASPHSPLQQRPHTSGTSTTHHLDHHHRNAPSAMGMSTLSSVSTLNPESTGSRTLKKKRSAFGWLKKAFSLDEEERMAFEQRKNEQAKTPYYDARSPRYLDGKRIR